MIEIVQQARGGVRFVDNTIGPGSGDAILQTLGMTLSYSVGKEARIHDENR